MTNRISNSFSAASHMNSVWIEGTVLEEPEESLSDAGTKLCLLQVGAHRILPVQNEFQVFHVEVRPSVLETCSSQLHKGRGVRIIGRIHQDRWKDRSGATHSQVKIVSEMIEARPNFSEAPTSIS